jgi:transcriptional regulator with XRE-family HTH domain
VDDSRVGGAFRAVRRRRRLTQTSVATLAGVSQQLVALIEAGRQEVVSVRSLRRVGDVLEISMPFEPRWRGGEAARLLDREHARLVEIVVGLLRRWGWEVLVEHTFNHFGERGSIDILGWHGVSRTLLVVEVKTRVLDLQDLLAAFDRRARLAPRLLAESRGWAAMSLGRVMVMPDRTATRDAVRRHQSTFDAVLPARGRDVRRWLRAPSGGVAGVWFLSSTN